MKNFKRQTGSEICNQIILPKNANAPQENNFVVGTPPKRNHILTTMETNAYSLAFSIANITAKR